MAFNKKNVVHLDQEAWERTVKRRRIIAIALLAGILVGLGASYLIRNVIIPGRAYGEAEAAITAGNIAEGIEKLTLLDDYNGAAKRAAKLAYSECGSDYDYLKHLAVDDVIEFGHYEQDGNAANGLEPIKWQVYMKDGNTVYLLAVDVLDHHVYHNEKTDIAWSDCDLRSWLNTDFLTEAFTEKERLLIAKTLNKASKNPVSHVTNGGNTEDKIFVPSLEEIMKSSRDGADINVFSLSALPTNYAVKRGVEKFQYGTATWWLRTPGTERDNITISDASGVPIYVRRVNYPGVGVRPAMMLLVYDDEG
ncbi:MAG: hypothetical protein IKZ82_05480 [Clostridia bacterium]|nr:hypothetical protein [Clostridia bacterium]